MSDVGEFIDDFLEHKYDPVKAHEYYMRTRKLVGRASNKVKQLVDKSWETDKEFDEKVREYGRARQKAQAQAEVEAEVAREERRIKQKQRIEQARNKANKVKDPNKRRGLLDKIRNIEKKIESSEAGKFYKDAEKDYDNAWRTVPGSVKKLATNPSRSNAKKIAKNFDREMTFGGRRERR